MTIVMKFGGTSVGDAEKIKRAAKLVNKASRKEKVVVVVSAISGVTDALLEITDKVSGLNKEQISKQVENIQEKHVKIARQAVHKKQNQVIKDIKSLTEELKDVLIGVKVTGVTEQGKDSIASFGEKLSSIILSGCISDSNESSYFFGDNNLIITTRDFSKAEPCMQETQKQVDQKIKAELDKGAIPVVTGFMGSTKKGMTTTLGRGSSDHIASIIGACLGVKEVQIWTDVDGLMSADPKIVGDSKLLNKVSFKEASELAYFGAKILHPKSIVPVMDRGIPVKIKNTHNPQSPGTTIVSKADKHPQIIKGITAKKDITLIDIVSTRMLDAHGFLAKVFDVFKEYKVSVDMISTTEVSISLTVDSKNTENLLPIKQELEKIADVNIYKNKALVCVVGEGLRESAGAAGRIFSCLGKNKINVECISQGASEISMSFLVDNNQAEKSVKILHKSIIEGDKND